MSKISNHLWENVKLDPTTAVDYKWKQIILSGWTNVQTNLHDSQWQAQLNNVIPSNDMMETETYSIVFTVKLLETNCV